MSTSPLHYPVTVIPSVRRLSATFRDRDSGDLVLMTGGSATVRVVNSANSVVLSDVACTIDEYTAYYDWATDGNAPGKYRVQFDATPPAGLRQIEPACAAQIELVARIGG